MEVYLFEIVWDRVFEMGYILQTYGTTKGGVLMISVGVIIRVTTLRCYVSIHS